MERAARRDVRAAWLVSLDQRRRGRSRAERRRDRARRRRATARCSVAFGAIGFVDAVGSVALVYHFHHAMRHDALAEHLEQLAHRVVVTGLFLVGLGAAVVGRRPPGRRGATADDSFAGTLLGRGLAGRAARCCRPASSRSRGGSGARRCSPTAGCRRSAPRKRRSRCSAPRRADFGLVVGRRAWPRPIVGLVAMTTAIVDPALDGPTPPRATTWWRCRPTRCGRRRPTGARARRTRASRPGRRARRGRRSRAAPTTRRAAPRPRAASRRSARRSGARSPRRSSGRAACSTRLVITKHSTMPMMSATSRTRMSSPFLSSAARAAIRDFVATSAGCRVDTGACRSRSRTSLPRRHQPPVCHGRPPFAPIGAVVVVVVVLTASRGSLPAPGACRAGPRSHRPRRRAAPPRPAPAGRAGAGDLGVAAGRHRYSPCVRRMRAAGVGTRKSSGSPAATRRRRSVDESSRPGHADRARRASPSGAGNGVLLAVDDRERDERAQLVDAVPRRQARRRRRTRRRGTARGRARRAPRRCRSCTSGRRARARCATARAPRCRRARRRASRSAARRARSPCPPSATDRVRPRRAPGRGRAGGERPPRPSGGRRAPDRRSRPGCRCAPSSIRSILRRRLCEGRVAGARDAPRAS